MGIRLDFAEITRILPHAHPMVLLDQVREVVPGRSIVASKAISGCEPCYEGLGDEIGGTGCAYPVSLLVESFGQAAAVLWSHSDARGTAVSSLEDGKILMFAAARGCTFSGNAYPGDVLIHRISLEHLTESAAFVSGRTYAGNRQIADFQEMTAVVG